MSKQNPLHKLKPRHHKFIHNVIINGMTQKDAYLDAGFKAKEPDKVASILAQDPLIKKEMQALAERLRIDRHEIELEYSKMIKSGEIRPSDRATFMRDYAKLRGWTQDNKESNSNDKLLNMLGHALGHITSTRNSQNIIDITPKAAEIERD